MKFVLLCAGYGTRLQKGVVADTSGTYTHLKGVAKPLIPLNGVPLITRWVRRLEKLSQFSRDKLYIVTNDFYAHAFEEWASQNGIPKDNVINDGTTSNEGRLGAIRDIDLAVEKFDGPDDVMILGGDTLFFQKDMEPILKEFESRPDCSLVTFYHDEDTLKTGIIETCPDQLVSGFLEKPHPNDTASRKACPCFYILRKEVLDLLHDYVSSSTCLADLDAPGTFIKYLFPKEKIYAMPVDGRFDIGNLESYIEADQHFVNEEQK